MLQAVTILLAMARKNNLAIKKVKDASFTLASVLGMLGSSPKNKICNIAESVLCTFWRPSYNFRSPIVTLKKVELAAVMACVCLYLSYSNSQCCLELVVSAL